MIFFSFQEGTFVLGKMVGLKSALVLGGIVC